VSFPEIPDRSATKWYIELKGGSFKSFNDLEMAFLMHYQLPIRYEIGNELLTSLCQDNATHILIIYMSGREDVG
jgi:hypothetical protein